MTEAARPLLYESSGGVVRLTLNRPEKRNALSYELIRLLNEALLQAEADEEARVITISGAGKDFCAGGDLAELRALAESSVPENIVDVAALERLFLDLRELDKPVVAVVHGRALAGGSGLATACDLILAREDAVFGYPEVRIGFVPAMVMAILRRNVPEKRAFEIITLGDTFTAKDAERWGLVNRVLAKATFRADVDEFVRSLVQRSRSAVMLGKRLLYQQDGMGFPAALRAGVAVNALARTTDDTRQGVERFLEGRPESSSDR